MNLRHTIKKVLRESIELDHSIRRRLNVNQQEMIDRYKKEVLRNQIRKRFENNYR